MCVAKDSEQTHLIHDTVMYRIRVRVPAATHTRMRVDVYVLNDGPSKPYGLGRPCKMPVIVWMPANSEANAEIWAQMKNSCRYVPKFCLPLCTGIPADALRQASLGGRREISACMHLALHLYGRCQPLVARPATKFHVSSRESIEC
jgi:hypothetical protein